MVVVGTLFVCFSPTAESFEVSAQIGSGVVRGGPEVRFHEGSTRVPPHAVGDITCAYFFFFFFFFTFLLIVVYWLESNHLTAKI